MCFSLKAKEGSAGVKTAFLISPGGYLCICFIRKVTVRLPNILPCKILLMCVLRSVEHSSSTPVLFYRTWARRHTCSPLPLGLELQ